jgi:hypothetical protein
MTNGQVPRNVANLDKQLRQNIAELYMALDEIPDKALAIDILAEHVAMMVDMINELKTKG